MSDSQHVYVRLAPFMPRHGNKVQRYNYKGITFVGGANPHWYRVTNAFAEELSALKQIDSDPYSRPLFEIKEQEEKEEIQAEENRRKLAAYGVITPTVPVAPDLKPAQEIDLSERTSGLITSSVATSGRSGALAPARGEASEEVVEVAEAESQGEARDAGSKRRRRY